MNENAPVLHRLATRIFNTPLMIHPAKLDTILAVLGSRVGIEAPVVPMLGPAEPEKNMATRLEAAANRPGASHRVTLGVIPVRGTLVHRTGGLGAMSGLRSYEMIRKDFRAVLADAELDAIVMDFTTYGGEVHGCFDLVDEIYQARGEKKIIGIANEYAYSAGYAIISACDEVYLTRTGGLGSIGVIARHLDRSARNEMDGLNYTTMFVGDRKNDFSQDEPLSDEAKRVLYDSLITAYDLFVETVARNRDMKESTVRATQAGLFEGKDAVAAGLADAVMSWDQAIEKIAADLTKSTGGHSMSTTEKMGLQRQLEALFKGSSNAEIAAALQPLGYCPAAAADEHEQALAAARAESRKEALEYAVEVYGMCALAKLPKMTGKLIEADTPLAECGKKILEAQALESGNDHIDNTVSATTTGAVSPLAADARTRADSARARK